MSEQFFLLWIEPMLEQYVLWSALYSTNKASWRPVRIDSMENFFFTFLYRDLNWFYKHVWEKKHFIRDATWTCSSHSKWYYFYIKISTWWIVDHVKFISLQTKCLQTTQNIFKPFETNEMDVILSYQPDLRWESKKTVYDNGIIMCERKKCYTIGSNDCILHIAQYRIMECIERKKMFSLCRIDPNPEYIWNSSYSLLVTSSNWIYRWFCFDLVSLVYSMCWLL